MAYNDILKSIDDNEPDNNPAPFSPESSIDTNQNATVEASKNVNDPANYSPDQMVQDIFNSSEPPKPEYNEQLQKRREKVAKLNAAGRGIAVLGDILSLSTGASAEQVVAEKSKNQEGYNDVVKGLAETGTRYTMGNERSYRSNLNRLLSTKMQLNQQKADSAGNAASNASGLLGSAAMLGGFGAESGINKEN